MKLNISCAWSSSEPDINGKVFLGNQGKVLSTNCQGLRDIVKRLDVINYFKDLKRLDVINYFKNLKLFTGHSVNY